MSNPKILVAVDFSESSQLAIAEARRLAAKLELAIAYVHVAPMPSPELFVPVQSERAALEASRAELKDLVDDTLREGILAEPHLCVGLPVMGILDVAARIQPLLIIAGSHGKGRMARALFGSVSESLLRRSPIPVLVVPSSAARQHSSGQAAWMCGECGHIRHSYETVRCVGCGANPAQWVSAPISHEPVDSGEPAVGEVERETVDQGVRNDPAGLFATSPAGTDSGDVNPELRVRY